MSHIQAYNSKIERVVSPQKIGAPTQKEYFDGLFFGVEIEVEIDPKSKLIEKLTKGLSDQKKKDLFHAEQYHNSPIAEMVAGEMSNLVKPIGMIKRDGSLANGLEIVSFPMTERYQKEYWKNWYDNYSNLGVCIKASCAMHVHVDKSRMTRLQIGKILNFLHSAENYTFIKMVAGRTPPKKYANLTNPKRVSDINRHSERYDGFNITNPDTIEFRIFKSTDQFDRFMSNLEFCRSLVKFTDPGNFSVCQLDLTHYLGFISKQYMEFPNLFEFLLKKKVCDYPVGHQKYGFKKVSSKVNKLKITKISPKSNKNGKLAGKLS